MVCSYDPFSSYRQAWQLNDSQRANNKAAKQEKLSSRHREQQLNYFQSANNYAADNRKSLHAFLIFRKNLPKSLEDPEDKKQLYTIEQRTTEPWLSDQQENPTCSERGNIENLRSVPETFSDTESVGSDEEEDFLESGVSSDARLCTLNRRQLWEFVDELVKRRAYCMQSDEEDFVASETSSNASRSEPTSPPDSDSDSMRSGEESSLVSETSSNASGTALPSPSDSDTDSVRSGEERFFLRLEDFQDIGNSSDEDGEEEFDADEVAAGLLKHIW